VLRPWTWFLTKRHNCRIFQNMSVRDIIKKVFGDAGFTDYEVHLHGAFSPKEYCVQYRESDFDFVSRLMEQEGYYYFFKHEPGKHTLTLMNEASGHESTPGYETVPYYPPAPGSRRTRDCVSSWWFSQEVLSDKYALTDFDFTKPDADLKTSREANRPGAQPDYALFDYPGGYATLEEGDAYVKTRLEEIQALGEVAQGGGDVRGLAPGALFALAEHPVDDQNRSWLVVEARYDAEASEFRAGAMGGAAGDLSFQCGFTAIDGTVQFRPPRTTRRPVIPGPQTAKVVGPSGEEIWTDKYGRIKVQFHWDREGKEDENSSCWLRVAQIWAGKQWGAQFLPRIGQEVIVEFLEGDPDRPIVTGRVYNGDAMPPYALPGQQTRSGIRSRSTKGGGPDDQNELWFEDEKGKEDIHFHAQKDFHRIVENDDALEVRQNRTTLVTNNRTATVKEGNDTLTVEQGNRSVTVSLGNDSLTVKTGDHVIDVQLGKVSIKALQEIDLTVGGNSVKIDQTGVAINGILVKVSGEAQCQVSAAMTQVSGSGMLQMNGGITMIG
jgi:type VI secretion system secreted protein VgrG